MKDTAILVNTARGPIVDTGALIERAAAGRIAGAALDVTDPEPLPGGHPLLGAPNLLVLPHLGSATVGHARAHGRPGRGQPAGRAGGRAHAALRQPRYGAGPVPDTAGSSRGATPRGP